jgi:hypothetical protein
MHLPPFLGTLQPIQFASHSRHSSLPFRISMRAPYLLLALLIPLSCGAREPELHPSLPPFEEIPAKRLDIQKELASSEAARKHVVERNMDLSQEQAQLFWPLYFDYRSRVGQFDKQLLNTLVRFAELQSQNQLKDSDANQFLETTVEREKLRAALRRSYLLKIREQLNARIAMRFYQLDAQLEHEVRGATLYQLPLLK